MWKRTVVFMSLLLAVVASGDTPPGPFGRQRVLPRTLVFSESQIKYPLDPNRSGLDYYSGGWVDWPLFIDDRLRDSETKGRPLIQQPDFLRIYGQYRLYGLDGMGIFTYFARVYNKIDIVGAARKAELKDFLILPILNSCHDTAKDTPRLIASPHVLKINGKTVFMAELGPDDKLLAELKKAYPDQLLFIGGASQPWDIKDNFYRVGMKLSEADRKTLEETVRGLLRRYDGMDWGDLCTWQWKDREYKRFASEFYREVMTLTAKVFAEPEFKGKIFAAVAVAGHENSYALGYILGSDGTRTLRSSLQTALDVGVDVVNQCEWDEQNENTSLRPTVFNSRSYMRVTRYLLLKNRGEKEFQLPGDDLAVPNLLYSARKIVALGELLRFELLNVPDNDRPRQYRAQLSLKSLGGKILHAFPEHTFSADQLQEFRPELPSEELAGEQVVLPCLTVTADGKTTVYEDGMPCVIINNVSTFDYKWVNMPLRDLLTGVKAEFTAVPSTEAGVYAVHAQAESPVELSFAEVMDNYLCVYSHALPGERVWRETAAEKVFRVQLQSVLPQRLKTGSISVENATAAWSGNPLASLNVIYWRNGAYVAIPAAEVGKAVFNIDIPGYFQGKIPAAEALRKEKVIIGGPKGFGLSVSRMLKMPGHPKNLRTQELSFTTTLLPEAPSSVVQLQLVAENGKIWRSRPLLVGDALPDYGNAPMTVYSDAAGAPVTVKVPRKLVPNLECQWSPENGILVGNSAARVLRGALGFYYDVASDRSGGGDSSYSGTVFAENCPDIPRKTAQELRPELVKQPEGGYSLKFDGVATFAMLPQGFIPRRCGFELSFKIKPEDQKRRQLILGCRGARNYPGSLTGVYLENGELTAEYSSQSAGTVTLAGGLSLPAGKWSDVEIAHDQATLSVKVNGKTVAQPCPGPGVYDMATVVGGYGEGHFFKGEIKDLKIRYAF